MRKIILVVTLLTVVALSSCKKKVVIESSLKKTTWLEENGTQTLEFAKKQVYVNGVELLAKRETIYIQDGQIWIDSKKEGIRYLFDYKLSGVNLFVAPELTPVFYDPSSPSVATAVKYKEV